MIKDYVQAYAWFNVAAANSFKKAAAGRDVIEKVITLEQIAEGEKR